MPLNYKKWDALQLSDDSDIEGHPNVDHKSLVRWKQRDIHEKREARKLRIQALEGAITRDARILERLDEIIPQVEAGGAPKFSSVVEQLKTKPSSETPPFPAGPKGEVLTYDALLLNLMLQVFETVKTNEAGHGDIGDKLVVALKSHKGRVIEAKESAAKDLEAEIKERDKYITSDDIHDGFSSSRVTKEEKPEPKPEPKKKKAAKTEETIEVLNPKAVASNAPPPSKDESKGEEADDEDDDDDEPIPELSPELLAFSKIPEGDWDRSWEFIKAHPRQVMAPGAHDALIVAGFRAQTRGEKKYARQCVHQALLVQYCEKLGSDGVRLFFQRMLSQGPNGPAMKVFLNDFEQTVAMMASRAENIAAEESAKESIQLVAEDPSQEITFNVPDGPPPENIVLEGAGTEGLDVEEVKKALQMRWDIFSGFDEPMKAALKSGKLDAVNEQLAKMEVPEAEEFVKLLDVGGILSFSRKDIVDQTGKERDVPVEQHNDVD
ncbi:hsp90 co-chaperone Cdc37 [Tulasnella sp. 419]|nr:hsp90 co-chaperone Cdc37 [Tulasnella sp. 419]